jgi:Family of unknown function (DUF6343)/Protein of unknown function (DUF3099)
VTQTGPSGTHHRIRSGDEPTHARSALRLRLTLALIGLANGIAGVILFTLLGSRPLTWAFAVLTLVALINVAVVAHHIRQGPHYQPGPTIPPYHPLDRVQAPHTPHPPATTRVRRRRYLVMMGLCVLLLILAWGWIRLYSVTAAVAMSAAAALVPPFAAILTNVDSPILRDDQPQHTDPTDPTGRTPQRGEHDR